MTTPRYVFSRPASRCLIAISAVWLSGLTSVQAQSPSQMVAEMGANEVKARNEDTHYSFYADEVSARTGGHRWTEKVVETGDGAVHRLLAIDGKPLTPDQAKVESDRIDDLVRHPDAFRRVAEAHRNDEAQSEKLLQLLPKAFLITPQGQLNGCALFAFRPNPAFQPSTYEERIAVSMAGTVSLRQATGRLCRLEAKITQPVEFGFGLLGRIEQGGYFSLERVPVDADHWKSDRISVHILGRILLLKTLTRNQDVVRSDIKLIPDQITLQQAATLSKP